MNSRRTGIACGALLALAAAVSEAAPANVAVSRAGSRVVGTRQIFSSTQLTVTWTATAGDRAHHYEVVATDAVQGTRVTATAVSTATGVTLTTLKASTPYSIVVSTCRDEACRDASAAAAVPGSTDTEYWQLQGTGHSVDRLTKAVSDGNARLSATRFGPDAGAMANRVQLYYGPMRTQGDTSQLTVAVASAAADPSSPASYLTFTSRSGASGLASPRTSPTRADRHDRTGEGVPIAGRMGGFVRLFFEATAPMARRASCRSTARTATSGWTSTRAPRACAARRPTTQPGGAANRRSRLASRRMAWPFEGRQCATIQVGWPTLDRRIGTWPRARS